MEEAQAEGVPHWEEVPVAHGVAIPDAEGDRVPEEDRHAEDVPQWVGEVEVDKEVVPEAEEETHAEGERDCDKLPVAHGVALPEADGDGVPEDDRLAEDVPQWVGETEVDKEVVPEVVEETLAQDELDCDKLPVVHGVALPEADGDGVPEDDRLAEDVPQWVGDVEVDRDDDPE